MDFWLKLILGIIVVVGVFLIRPVRNKLKEDYPNIVLTVLVAFFATFFGVWLAFQTENIRQNKSEFSFVKHNLSNLMFETSINIANIKKIRSQFSPDEISIIQLSTLVSSDIISEPLVVKYTTSRLIVSVSVMVDSINKFNNYSSVALNHFILTQKNTEAMLKRIYESLDRAEFIILTVQREINNYVIAILKEDLEGEKHKEIIAWLSIYDTEHLEAKLKLLRGDNENPVD